MADDALAVVLTQRRLVGLLGQVVVGVGVVRLLPLVVLGPVAQLARLGADEPGLLLLRVRVAREMLHHVLAAHPAGVLL